MGNYKLGKFAQSSLKRKLKGVDRLDINSIYTTDEAMLDAVKSIDEGKMIYGSEIGVCDVNKDLLNYSSKLKEGKQLADIDIKTCRMLQDHIKKLEIIMATIK